MPEHDRHEDLAAYLIDGLEPAERVSFEAHLATCKRCREEARALSGTVTALARMEPHFDAPPGLSARVLSGVAAAAEAPSPAPPVEPRRRFARPRLLLAGLAGAAALLAAVVIATQVGDEDVPVDDRGTVEIAGTLITPEGSDGGELVVRALGSGRRIDFDSEALSILPKGEYYELWFVGPGDAPGDPNRISAGTFHPDEQGVTDVVLHAAVDPALYPRVEITAEPGNGHPGVDGKVVLELTADDIS